VGFIRRQVFFLPGCESFLRIPIPIANFKGQFSTVCALLHRYLSFSGII
jgi:hypothetical protein